MAGLVAGALAALSFGMSSADAGELDTYVGKPVAGVEKKADFIDKAWDISKYLAGVGFGGALWNVSHEMAHVVAGNATGVGVSYDPAKDPLCVHYEKEPNAITSGAGLFVQNFASYRIVNSKNTNLKENPAKLGYLLVTLASNSIYAFGDNKDNEMSDVNQLEKSTGIPGDVYRAALAASSVYIAKKAWDNFKNGPSGDLKEKFGVHFGEDGTVGMKCNVGGKNSYLTAGVNPERKSFEVGFNIPLGGKKGSYKHRKK